MSKMNNVAKLIYISDEQKMKLDEIKNMVTETGGSTSVSEIIRDAIDLAIYLHIDEILEYHKPKSFKDKWS